MLIIIWTKWELIKEIFCLDTARTVREINMEVGHMSVVCLDKDALDSYILKIKLGNNIEIWRF